jgi:KDO2-lipid IV(A) lauroyltransferase
MQQLQSAFIKLLIRFFALLPLPLVQAIGAFSGRIAWLLKADIAKYTALNLAACFPEMSDNEREVLGKRSMEQTFISMFEVGKSWILPVSKTLESIKNVKDSANINSLLERGKGVIVIVPHLGNWEVLGVYLSQQYPLHVLYQPPTLTGMENFIVAGRTRAGTQIYPTNKSGVMAIYKALRKNELVAILPDQEPPTEGGLISPFFGKDALTMTLVSKLVHKADAKAVCAYARRLEKGQGYEIIIKSVHEELYDKDLQDSVNALNKTIEESIRENPEQYQWEYKRFRQGPAGKTRFYRSPE